MNVRRLGKPVVGNLTTLMSPTLDQHRQMNLRRIFRFQIYVSANDFGFSQWRISAPASIGSPVGTQLIITKR
jgi:hypothetical protein